MVKQSEKAPLGRIRPGMREKSGSSCRDKVVGVLSNTWEGNSLDI